MRVKALNPGSATITLGAADPYGGYASRTVKITGAARETRRVAEHSPAGTVVGAPVTGTPYREDTLAYTLTGEAADAFVIDASTGQITVKAGATLDRENKRAYTGKVAWTVQGETAIADLTIRVTNLPPPGRPDAPIVTRSATDPTTILDVTWTAPDTPDSLPITDYDVQYRESGEESWTVHDFTGTATSTTLTGLTPDTTYQVRVRAHNAEGAGEWSSPGEGATAPENNSPQFSRLASTRAVPENSPAGTPVGNPVTATDTEGHTLTYTMKTASPLFDLDAATGQISVAEGVSLDYEAMSTSTFIVIVEASDGLDNLGIDDGGHIIDAEIKVAISVTDVDEPPPKLDPPSVVRSSSSPTSALKVTWNAPDMTGKPPVTSYAIAFREAGKIEREERRLEGLQTSATITGLRAGTTYEVSVRAFNDEGSGPWSDYGRGSTARPVVPVVPIPTPPTHTDAEPTPDTDADAGCLSRNRRPRLRQRRHPRLRRSRRRRPNPRPHLRRRPRPRRNPRRRRRLSPRQRRHPSPRQRQRLSRRRNRRLHRRLTPGPTPTPAPTPTPTPTPDATHPNRRRHPRRRRRRRSRPTPEPTPTPTPTP